MVAVCHDISWGVDRWPGEPFSALREHAPAQNPQRGQHSRRSGRQQPICGLCQPLLPGPAAAVGGDVLYCGSRGPITECTWYMWQGPCRFCRMQGLQRLQLYIVGDHLDH